MKPRLVPDPLVPADAYREPRRDEPEPAPVAVALRYLDEFLDRLDSVSEMLADLEQLEAGTCDDCETEARRRFLYGPRRLELCRRCALARATVITKRRAI